MAIRIVRLGTFWALCVPLLRGHLEPYSFIGKGYLSGDDLKPYTMIDLVALIEYRRDRLSDCG